jgi:hypothetical protein
MSSIATALAYAHEGDQHVDVLVEGHWLGGKVAHLDGFGLVIERDSGGQSVIRLEHIAVVTVGDEDAKTAAPPTVVPQRSMTAVG